MAELDCSFIPVRENDCLIGTITDRDIVVHFIVKGKNPDQTSIHDVISQNIEYCFKSNDLDEAVKHMEEKQIYRLSSTQ